MKDIRFRRLDEHNFVIERYVEESEEGRKEGAKEWKVLGYYGTVEGMLRDAPNKAISGDSGAELAKALENCTSTLLTAFQKAVEDGDLLLDIEGKEEQYRKMVATKKAKAKASA